MNINGQGHALTFVQGHLDSTFSNFFSLGIAKPIEAKFHVEPPWDERNKVSTNALCHMIKMAAMLIYDKHLKKLLLWNQKVDDLETWYVLWLLEYYYICSNDDSGLTLTFFYSNVKFGPFCFCMGKISKKLLTPLR